MIAAYAKAVLAHLPSPHGTVRIEVDPDDDLGDDLPAFGFERHADDVLRLGWLVLTRWERFVLETGDPDRARRALDLIADQAILPPRIDAALGGIHVRLWPNDYVEAAAPDALSAGVRDSVTAALVDAELVRVRCC